MAKRAKSKQSVEDLLRDLLIVTMGLAGIPQQNIRAVVGGDIVEINRIVKQLKRQRRTMHD